MNAEFTVALETWLAWLLHNAGRSPATCSKYRGHLECFARWYDQPPKDSKLAPIGTDPLRPSLDDLERFAGIYAHSLKLTPRARKPLVSALRGFFRWFSAQPGGGQNAAAALPQPKAGRRLPRAASLADAERLLMAPDVGTFAGLRDAAILALFMGCGLRVSGLVGLNESSLFWMRDETGIERLVVRTEEKGKRERLIPVANEAATLLRAYMGHEDMSSIPRTLQNGDAVLFVSLRNHTIPACDYHGQARRLGRRSIVVMIKRYAEQAGVSAAVAHPHALRHLYGAELMEDDTHLLTIQALLGHADPKSSEIYAGIAVRRMRKAVDRSNPLAKMRSPLLESLRQLHRATSAPQGAHSGPASGQNPKCGGYRRA